MLTLCVALGYGWPGTFPISRSCILSWCRLLCPSLRCQQSKILRQPKQLERWVFDSSKSSWPPELCVYLRGKQNRCGREQKNGSWVLVSYADGRLHRRELWYGVRLKNLQFHISKFLLRMALMSTRLLKRLHGMHWHIVSHLGTRQVKFMEMERMMVLHCRNTRVRMMDALVNFLIESDQMSNVFLWVVWIGVVSPSIG